METIFLIEKGKVNERIKDIVHQPDRFYFRWDFIFEDEQGEELEKAIHNYKDNALNRHLHRVGGTWGTEKKFNASLKDNPKYQVRGDKEVSGEGELSFIGHFEKVMEENNLTRLKFNVKDQRNVAMLTKISNIKTNRLYKLGPNHFEIIHYGAAEKVVGGKDYYDQFVNHPEDAIRFIVAKYLKDPSRRTICRKVLQTTINAQGSEKNCVVDLSHEEFADKGIVHAVDSHYKRKKDFESPAEMAEAIQSVLETVVNFEGSSAGAREGQFKTEWVPIRQSSGGTIHEKGYSVLLRKEGKNNYVVGTTYNANLDKDEKQRTQTEQLNYSLESFLEKSVSPTSSIVASTYAEAGLTRASDSGKTFRLHPSQSEYKDTKSLSNKQGIIEKSERITIFEYLDRLENHKYKGNKLDNCDNFSNFTDNSDIEKSKKTIFVSGGKVKPHYRTIEVSDDIDEQTNKTKSKEYERIRRISDDIRAGRKRIVRLDERGEQGRLYGGQTAIEATCLLGEYRRTASALYRESEERDDPTIGDLESKEEELLTKHAKSEGKWFDYDTIKRKAIEQLESGQEANVFVYGDENNRHVVKTINYKLFSLLPSHFIDNRIALYNGLFPETKYELLGFTKDADDEFAFVVKQPYIEGHELVDDTNKFDEEAKQKLREEVDKFLNKKLIFKRQGITTFANDQYIIEDVHLRNVMRQKNTNKLIFIDAVPNLNTPDSGYGGTNHYREFDIVDNNNTNKMEKSDKMTIFEWLESKLTKPTECIIKGERLYRVENGWIPAEGTNTSILLISNDILEKGGKRAALGEIRKFGGKDYMKTPKGWRPVPKGRRGSSDESTETGSTGSTTEKKSEGTFRGIDLERKGRLLVFSEKLKEAATTAGLDSREIISPSYIVDSEKDSVYNRLKKEASPHGKFIRDMMKMKIESQQAKTKGDVKEMKIVKDDIYNSKWLVGCTQSTIEAVMLKNEMYKNRFFEEGSYSGFGSSSTGLRRDWEGSIVGTTFEKELNSMALSQYARPAYGFIGTPLRVNAMQQYGAKTEVHFAFNLNKKRVEDRTTFTPTNSSSSDDEYLCRPITTPNSKRNERAFPQLFGKTYMTSYNEIQVWGGFDRFDVESIQVHVSSIGDFDVEKALMAYPKEYKFVQKLRKAGYIVNVKKKPQSGVVTDSSEY